MANQTVFQRVEKKYLLTPAQYEELFKVLLRYMQVDGYGRHTICNLYYDTPDYRLIRSSLEKPVYKEKLRLRSYGTPTADSTVFVELKKKYKGIVYKRREGMSLAQAQAYLADGSWGGARSQILREIDYFRALYRPEPKVFLAYDRVALFGREDPDLRITFDQNIRWRTAPLALEAGDAGAPLATRGLYLTALKLPQAMPLWLARTLDLLGIFPVSISKYGSCYQQFLSKLQPAPANRSAQQPNGGIFCA